MPGLGMWKGMHFVEFSCISASRAITVGSDCLLLDEHFLSGMV